MGVGGRKPETIGIFGFGKVNLWGHKWGQKTQAERRPPN
jgi:hypothetical protein